MILSREKLLAQTLRIERLTIPWIEGDGGPQEVIVRALPFHVLERLQKLDSATENVQAIVFVQSVVDESGNRLFKDEDATLVGEKVDSSLLALVTATAYRLSTPTAAQAEALKKSSGQSSTEGSGASPSP